MRRIHGLMASRAIICIILSSLLVPTVVLQAVNAQTFYNKPFTVKGSYYSGGYCYVDVPTHIYDSAKSTIVGSLTVTHGAVDLFILTKDEYNIFWGRDLCIRPSMSELFAGPISSTYSFSYLVPDNATHYFVILNPYASDATGTITLAW